MSGPMEVYDDVDVQWGLPRRWRLLDAGVEVESRTLWFARRVCVFSYAALRAQAAEVHLADPRWQVWPIAAAGTSGVASIGMMGVSEALNLDAFRFAGLGLGGVCIAVFFALAIGSVCVYRVVEARGGAFLAGLEYFGRDGAAAFYIWRLESRGLEFDDFIAALQTRLEEAAADVEPASAAPLPRRRTHPAARAEEPCAARRSPGEFWTGAVVETLYPDRLEISTPEGWYERRRKTVDLSLLQAAPRAARVVDLRRLSWLWACAWILVVAWLAAFAASTWDLQADWSESPQLLLGLAAPAAALAVVYFVAKPLSSRAGGVEFVFEDGSPAFRLAYAPGRNASAADFAEAVSQCITELRGAAMRR